MSEPIRPSEPIRSNEIRWSDASGNVVLSVDVSTQTVHWHGSTEVAAREFWDSVNTLAQTRVTELEAKVRELEEANRRLMVVAKMAT